MIKDINIEIRPFTVDDISPTPKCYQEGDEPVNILSCATYGMLYNKGTDQKPVYYMRNSNGDKFRWAGIINLGDGPLEGQTSAHHNDLAQGDAKCEPYQKLADGVYGMTCDSPKVDLRWYDRGAHWIEGDVFDLEVKPFPNALLAHKNSPQKMNFFHQFVELSGTYEGKPVVGLGGFDRGFNSGASEAQFTGEAMTYIGAVYSNIRADGRRESMYTTLFNDNGKGIGYYFLEGEEPILTDEVWLDTEWYHYPYAPKDDPTVVFKDAVWRFGGKEFYFEGKWGSKGYTPTPRLEKLGQSHVYGSWRCGEERYAQKMAYTWNENMECTDERVIKMGYKVIE